MLCNVLVCVHCSVSLHLQSVTDVAATQEPPSRELILMMLVVPTLCTHLTLYMCTPHPGVV